MKNITVHLLLPLLLLSIVNSQHGNFTRRTYIIPTEPSSVSLSSVQCPDSEDNSNVNIMIRCLTLNELINSSPGKHGMFQSREEVVFLSGTHVVDGTKRDHVYSDKTSNLVLRGETNKVTIVCLKQLIFVFARGRYVKVSNLTFINCTTNSSQIMYRNYRYNCTLLYYGLQVSMLIENVEIKIKSQIAIAVYVQGDSTYSTTVMQLAFTNLKSSGGIAITPDPYEFFRVSLTFINIKNSSFNDSYVEIVPHNEFSVTIKNVSFENCNTWSSLIFKGIKYPFLAAEIENLIISKSTSPYVIYANKSCGSWTEKWNLCLFCRSEGEAKGRSSRGYARRDR